MLYLNLLLRQEIANKPDTRLSHKDMEDMRWIILLLKTCYGYIEARNIFSMVEVKSIGCGDCQIIWIYFV